MKKITTLFVLFILICFTAATADAIRIHNVTITDVAKTQATVNWKTDVETNGTVLYDTNRPPTTSVDDDVSGTDHSVTLTDLFSGRKYFVNIIARNPVDYVVDTNDLESYSFTTMVEFTNDTTIQTSVPTGDSIENAQIVNKSRMTITGTAEPGSTVRFFVNTDRIPSQIIETGQYSLEVGMSATFNATIKLFETKYEGITGLNSITTQITDQAGNKESFTKYVIVDTKAPTIFLEDIKTPRSKREVLFRGSLSEEATVEIVQGGRTEAVTVLNNSINHSFFLPGDGSYIVNITATDNAGNKGVQSYNLTLDSVPCRINFEEDLFRQEQRFSIVTVAGNTTEPNCKIKLTNIGDLAQHPDYRTNRTQIGSQEFFRGHVNVTNLPEDEVTQYGTSYEIGVGGAIVRYNKEFNSGENAKFSELIALEEGHNDLVFNITDEAGNSHKEIRTVEFEPGSEFWKIGTIQTLPNEVYSDRLLHPDSRGVPISIMYEIYYYGPTDLPITVRGVSASLDADKEDNDYFDVDESYYNWNEDEKKLFVMTKIDAEENDATNVEDLPDQLDFALVSTVSYRYGETSLNENVYFTSAVAVEKPFDYNKLLTPEMINDTLDVLNDTIEILEAALNVSETITLATVATCVGMEIYTSYAGPGENGKNLKRLYSVCDRVWCPTIPPDCNAMEFKDGKYIQDSEKGKSTLEWVKKSDMPSAEQQKCKEGQNAGVKLISEETGGVFSFPSSGNNTNTFTRTSVQYFCTDMSKTDFESHKENPPYFGSMGACYVQGQGDKPPEFHDTKCWPDNADKVNNDGKVNTYDGFFISLRCGCFSGVTGHLNNWLRVTKGFQKCLQQAYIGEVRGAYCERLFAQFVCDLITWALLKIMKSSAKRAEADSGETADAVRGNFAQVKDALDKRYSGLRSSRLGLDSKQIVHKFCIAAITGDWSDLRNVLTDIGTVPVRPVIGPMFPESRFTAWNPFTGEASVDYYLTIGLMSGGQRISGKVEIICDKNLPNGEFCPPEKTVVHSETVFVEAGGSVERNLYWQDEHARYWANTVVMDLEYTFGGQAEKYHKEEQILRKGPMIVQCHWQMVPPMIVCESITGEGLGTMEFKNAKFAPNDIDTYYPGNPVYVKTDIAKIAPFATQFQEEDDEETPELYLVYNMKKPNGKVETNMDDKDALKEWKVNFDGREVNIFTLIEKLPEAGEIGVSGGYEWKDKIFDVPDLKTDGTILVTASIKNEESKTVLRRIKSITFYDKESNVVACDKTNLANEFSHACKTDATISRIKLTIAGESTDKNVRFVVFNYPKDVDITNTTGTPVAEGVIEGAPQQMDTTAGSQYPPGDYKINITLFHDKDENGIIDEDDDAVPFGNDDAQTKFLEFEFKKDRPTTCSGKPSVEIIYPRRNAYVTKNLKYALAVGDTQGVQAVIWDDCNSIRAMDVYDEKAFEEADDKAKDKDPKDPEPYPVSLADKDKYNEEEFTFTTTKEITGYEKDEEFELLVRVIDTAGYAGQDEVLVIYSSGGQ